METTLAKSIRVTNEKAAYDAARHTGNAGILIGIEPISEPISIEETDRKESGGGQDLRRAESQALGFDVFCRHRKGLYMDTPETEKAFLYSEIEGGRLETLVFTHAHDDHFCLEDVLEALKLNPKLHVISTRAVIRMIRERTTAGILTEIPPEEPGMVRMKLPEDPGMSLMLFNSPHMGEQFADVQNLVCLLEAGGKRILLPGDARPDAELFERTASWSPVIDWLIGPFPLLGLPSTRKRIAAALTVRHALAVHLPRPERDIHGWRASAAKVCERASDGLPMPLFGDVPGQTYLL